MAAFILNADSIISRHAQTETTEENDAIMPWYFCPLMVLARFAGFQRSGGCSFRLPGSRWFLAMVFSNAHVDLFGEGPGSANTTSVLSPWGKAADNDLQAVQ